jgi:hypothetical protein
MLALPLKNNNAHIGEDKMKKLHCITIDLPSFALGWSTNG